MNQNNLFFVMQIQDVQNDCDETAEQYARSQLKCSNYTVLCFKAQVVLHNQLTLSWYVFFLFFCNYSRCICIDFTKKIILVRATFFFATIFCFIFLRLRCYIIIFFYLKFQWLGFCSWLSNVWIFFNIHIVSTWLTAN